MSSMVVGCRSVQLNCAIDGELSAINSRRQSRQCDCLRPRPTVGNGGPLIPTEPLDGLLKRGLFFTNKILVVHVSRTDSKQYLLHYFNSTLFIIFRKKS